MIVLFRIINKHGFKILSIFLLFGFAFYLFGGSDPKYVGYAPDQPIPFSHKIHAGELEISCQFCHTGVEQSQHATVPDTATCMRCHEYVAGDSKDIQYLRKTFELGIPIRWKKVHDLPDHVRFSHQPHIARGLDCATCHGAVETMEKVEVVAPFNMGWCVNCHRENTTQETKPGNNVAVQLTDCSVCHY